MFYSVYFNPVSWVSTVQCDVPGDVGQTAAEREQRRQRQQVVTLPALPDSHSPGHG